MMEWEQKAELVKLGNQIYVSAEAKKEFQDYVIANVDNFDEQTWDMFVQLVHIDIAEMKEDITYWTIVFQHLKDVDCNNAKFGLRTGMRIAMIQTICEDNLKLK